MNFVGAPALTAAQFKNYHQNFIFARESARYRAAEPIRRGQACEHRHQPLVVQTRDWILESNRAMDD
jgi:hypothetical protein